MVALGLGAALIAGCSSGDSAPPSDLPTIVVTHAVLGSVVAEIAGPAADVVVLIPNGVDPHLFEPSAQDIELLNSADLIVVNGLGLEARLEDSLARVREQRIPIFSATDHIGGEVLGADEAHGEGEVHGADEAHGEGEVHGADEAHGEGEVHGADEAHGEGEVHGADEAHGDDVTHAAHEHAEGDPHFWTDPRSMAAVVEALGEAISDLGLDIGDRALMFSERILTLDQELLRRVESLPVDRRVLVTGHESLGYLAERYGFAIIATIIPGLTSGAEVSAGNLAAVKEAVERSGVGVIFTELGTSSSSTRVVSGELGVDVVEISTHLVSEEALEQGEAGEAYLAFIEELVESIVTALEADSVQQ